MNRTKDARVCIIGAGPSGITAAKNLIQAGITNFVIYEKNDQVGGNWVFNDKTKHSSVYETTHLISSRRYSEYFDYPMPADYPDYPSHTQMLAYFQGYAKHFGVMPYIQFNTEVHNAEELPDKTWRITLGNGKIEIFDFLLIANGHHWNPRYPTYEGEFTGEFVHSHEYKRAAPFAGKRVLVIGAGNSGCDISVETARVSAFTAMSMRRGQYIVPKFVFGQPPDVVNGRFYWLPAWIRLPFFYLTLKLAVGSYKDYGLPQPEHGILNAHVTNNSEVLYAIRHGKVHVRPAIKRFNGKQVEFTDGRVEEYDSIIAATGFKISLPFFDPNLLSIEEGVPPLYKNVFHPDHPSLFFIGLVQPLGSIWPLSDLHAKLAANYIIGNYNLPKDVRQRIARHIEYMKKHYVNSPRHSVEVEFHPHIVELKREIPKSAPEWKHGHSDR
ncbi:MAG: NAD(P)-binding domain-containing protein [Anaerolineales bacterium]